MTARAIVILALIVGAIALMASARNAGHELPPAFYAYGNQVRIVALPAEGRSALTTARVLDHDDEVQPDTLPTLPAGMTVGMIVDGDALYHGKGACYYCHGQEATGVQGRGSAITNAVLLVPITAPGGWDAADSLLMNGIPEGVTRSTIAMPPRGLRSDLGSDEVRRVAAYVWAISQTRGEPWPGGHAQHARSRFVTIPKTTGP